MSEVGNVAYVGLIGAGEIENRKAGFSLDIGKELIEAIAVSGLEVFEPEIAIGLRSGTGLSGRRWSFGRSRLGAKDCPKSFAKQNDEPLAIQFI